MAPHLGQNVFMPVPRRTSVPQTGHYIPQNGLGMLVRLDPITPEEVWLQLPQVPLLWIGLIYRAAAGRPVKLIADCHNAMFGPSGVPLGIGLLEDVTRSWFTNVDVLETGGLRRPQASSWSWRILGTTRKWRQTTVSGCAEAVVRVPSLIRRR